MILSYVFEVKVTADAKITHDFFFFLEMNNMKFLTYNYVVKGSLNLILKDIQVILKASML